MTANAGPNITRNSLVFLIDKKNTKKSWQGAPITNQFLAPTPLANGDVTFSVQGTAGFKRVSTGTYGNYEIQPADIVYRYDLGLTGCHYHGNVISIPSGVYATLTFDYYISPDAANYPTINLLGNIEGNGGVSISASNFNKGIWQSMKATSALTTATGNANLLLYPGGCSTSYLASSGYILYKNPQVTLTTYNPTVEIPFVNGTRSNTQAIKEMVSGRTLTATNLTYNPDNTYSFNGTTSVLDFPTSGLNFSTGQTIIMILKPTEATADRRNPYNHEYAGYGTISHEPSGEFSYYHGTSGGNGVTYQGSSSTFTVTQNETAMIAVTRGASSVKWYKNGIFYTSTVNSYPTAVTAVSTASIGSGYAGPPFQGDIDFVALYDRQLSDAEIATNFNALRGRYGL